MVMEKQSRTWNYFLISSNGNMSSLERLTRIVIKLYSPLCCPATRVFKRNRIQSVSELSNNVYPNYLKLRIWIRIAIYWNFQIVWISELFDILTLIFFNFIFICQLIRDERMETLNIKYMPLHASIYVLSLFHYFISPWVFTTTATLHHWPLTMPLY